MKNLTARLANEPRLHLVVDPTTADAAIGSSRRRRRTVSLSQSEEQSEERAAVKRQRHSSTGEAEEANLLLRFAKFLPPSTQPQSIGEATQVLVADAEMIEEAVDGIEPFKGSSVALIF